MAGKGISANTSDLMTLASLFHSSSARSCLNFEWSSLSALAKRARGCVWGHPPWLSAPEAHSPARPAADAHRLQLHRAPSQGCPPQREGNLCYIRGCRGTREIQWLSPAAGAARGSPGPCLLSTPHAALSTLSLLPTLAGGESPRLMPPWPPSAQRPRSPPLSHLSRSTRDFCYSWNSRLGLEKGRVPGPSQVPVQHLTFSPPARGVFNVLWGRKK